MRTPCQFEGYGLCAHISTFATDIGKGNTRYFKTKQAYTDIRAAVQYHTDFPTAASNRSVQTK